jgi:cupin fold WbuC family metalloprotein
VNIYDKNNNLVGIHIKSESIAEGKNFLTDSNNTLQLGTFNLNKGTLIPNHIHKKQERKILTTGEVLVVLEGEILVSFYEEDLELLTEITVKKHEAIAMYSGGHGIEVLENTKFIEIKQGPYLEDMDKELF